VRQPALHVADRAERELDLQRRAVLAPRGERPGRRRIGKHPLQQRLIAAQQERGERLADRLAFAEAEVRGKGGVDVAHRVPGRRGIQQRERRAAGVERRARQRAIRQQLEQRGC